MNLAGGIALGDLPGPRLRRPDLRGLDLVTHLLHTAQAHPQPVVAHAVESFFAPHMETVGCVGVRGVAAIRQVLTNVEDFAPLQPDWRDLPEDIQSMSRGVFTFHGRPHSHHRSALREVIGLDDRSAQTMRSAARNAVCQWQEQERDLIGACRVIARDVLGEVLFGTGEASNVIARGVGQVVDGRRAGRLASTPAERAAAHRQLVHASRSLAGTVAAWIGSRPREGILAPLGHDLSDDATTTLAIAHATAICAAATEPTAASLAWAALALTQRPDLQAAIREELDGPHGTPAPAAPSTGRTLLDRVVLESQRLLPSSAIVTRATLRPVEIAGHLLPQRCEVMISSFLAQRDLTRFPEPRLFSPDRWLDLRPTPFQFFPFGAGARACLGASLARAVLRTTVAELVTRGMLSLAFDTRVGWQMPDALMPSTGVPVLLRASADGSFGRARGPICEIVDFAPLAP